MFALVLDLHTPHLALVWIVRVLQSAFLHFVGPFQKGRRWLRLKLHLQCLLCLRLHGQRHFLVASVYPCLLRLRRRHLHFKSTMQLVRGTLRIDFCRTTVEARKQSDTNEHTQSTCLPTTSTQSTHNLRMKIVQVLQTIFDRGGPYVCTPQDLADPCVLLRHCERGGCSGRKMRSVKDGCAHRPHQRSGARKCASGASLTGNILPPTPAFLTPTLTLPVLPISSCAPGQTSR